MWKSFPHGWLHWEESCVECVTAIPWCLNWLLTVTVQCNGSFRTKTGFQADIQPICMWPTAWSSKVSISTAPCVEIGDCFLNSVSVSTTRVCNYLTSTLLWEMHAGWLFLECVSTAMVHMPSTLRTLHCSTELPNSSPTNCCTAGFAHFIYVAHGAVLNHFLIAFTRLTSCAQWPSGSVLKRDRKALLWALTVSNTYSPLQPSDHSARKQLLRGERNVFNFRLKVLRSVKSWISVKCARGFLFSAQVTIAEVTEAGFWIECLRTVMRLDR